MKENKLGSILYVVIGFVIFSLLAFQMFRSNYDYIRMDLADDCVAEGGEWRSHTQECILDNKKPQH